ncbi:NAD(P)/FAD-dependent oxidoreductase [Candidatus Gromoviella agglomerans]|uniref:NAD(P)/FAD-dependent oxidoreductase n=1 Tax=Candidatus Gromoviella agglomerans TaxID=2806609 RepID=UPI001E485673|nr:NAD(P)/FAD-dependent oxidoreductase [Candidatus Gromoviella agglomerans]UFX98257.1 Ferredoxin--NADP reductase [Candidatus Gromoviella agglomerans]
MILDVCIVGSGPSGLFAAFQCGMLGLSCVVLETLTIIGGQCSNLYPEKYIHDIGGIKSILGDELIKKLIEQAMQFENIYILTNEQVVSINNDFDNKSNSLKHVNENFLREKGVYSKNHMINNSKENLDYQGKLISVITAKNTRILCRSVIIASGMGSFEPRKIPLPNLSQYENISIFYSITNKDFFKNKNIIIVGGGDSALDWANDLSNICKNITLVHRRDTFSGMSSNVKKLPDLVKVLKPYNLLSIDSKGDFEIRGAMFVNIESKEKIYVEADAILAFFGLNTSIGHMKNWKLNMDEKNKIITDPITCETSTSMVFAIGDCASSGKICKLIATGFDEAAQAVHQIFYRLHPNTRRIDYSTTKFANETTHKLN